MVGTVNPAADFTRLLQGCHRFVSLMMVVHMSSAAGTGLLQSIKYFDWHLALLIFGGDFNWLSQGCDRYVM